MTLSDRREEDTDPGGVSLASWLTTSDPSCVRLDPLRFLITRVAAIGCCKECSSSGCSLKGSVRLLHGADDGCCCVAIRGEPLGDGIDDGRCCFAIRGEPLGDGIFRGDHTGDPNEELSRDEAEVEVLHSIEEILDKAKNDVEIEIMEGLLPGCRNPHYELIFLWIWIQPASAPCSAAHDSLCLTGDGNDDCSDQSQILIGLVATIRLDFCPKAACPNDWCTHITLFTSETGRRRRMVQNDEISVERWGNILFHKVVLYLLNSSPQQCKIKSMSSKITITAPRQVMAHITPDRSWQRAPRSTSFSGLWRGCMGGIYIHNCENIILVAHSLIY